MYNFTIMLLIIFISLFYSYAIGGILPKGKTRFFSLLPIISLFLVLPLRLSSIHVVGITSFFISWLANFKLFLYAYGQGPLSTHPSTISFTRFVFIACLPIKIQESPTHNGRNKSFPNYAFKGLLLAMLFRLYDYTESIHPKVILILYCLHIYLFLELLLAMVAVMARALLGLELEPQFNEPYLSTSLQDFWGRRWNIMVTTILHSTVYQPSLKIFVPIIGRRWAALPAILGTFVVSALMHELIFYYLGFGDVKPTWEVTYFFLLHGLCVAIEVSLKKVVNGRWRLPRLVSTPLTVGFVLVTVFWLFFPPLLRCKADVRAFEEYAALSAFLKHAGRASPFWSFNICSGW